MTQRERPILFSGAMVQAILEGRKTQTRRVVKPQPSKLWGQGVMQSGPKRGRFCAHAAFEGAGARADMYIPSPYGAPGDRLWVRERWAVGQCADGFKPRELHPGTWTRDNGGLWYEAGSADPTHPISPRGRWRSSRFMPRWASRLTLELTEVRVERLHDISEADAMAEGVEKSDSPHTRSYPYLGAMHPIKGVPKVFGSATAAFESIWDSINGRKPGRAWADNPWVWALTFKRVIP